MRDSIYLFCHRSVIILGLLTGYQLYLQEEVHERQSQLSSVSDALTGNKSSWSFQFLDIMIDGADLQAFLTACDNNESIPFALREALGTNEYFEGLLILADDAVGLIGDTENPLLLPYSTEDLGDYFTNLQDASIKSIFSYSCPQLLTHSLLDVPRPSTISSMITYTMPICVPLRPPSRFLIVGGKPSSSALASSTGF